MALNGKKYVIDYKVPCGHYCLFLNLLLFFNVFNVNGHTEIGMSEFGHN